MWRQQKDRGRGHENYRGSDRGNFRSHEERDDRDRFLDRDRGDFDSYNDHSERDRHASEWDQHEPNYSEREDARYVDEGDNYGGTGQRYHEGSRDYDREDARYREDGSRYDDNYRDTGEVTGTRDDYSGHREDERYRYDDRRHVVGTDRQMEDDRPRDDWDSCRDEKPHLRDDRIDYRDEYRDHERSGVRDETYLRGDRDIQRDEDRHGRDGIRLRDDRDIHRDEDRQPDRDSNRLDPRRWDDRSRFLETEITFRNDDRRPLVEQKRTSRERSKQIGNRTDARNSGQAGRQGIGENVRAQDKSGARNRDNSNNRNRDSSNNRNRDSSINRNRDSGINRNNGNNSKTRRHEPQRQREDGSRNEKRTVEGHSSAEKSRNDRLASSRNRNSGQRDKRQTEDQRKHEKLSAGNHTPNTHTHSKDRDSDRGSTKSTTRTDSKGKQSPRSRPDSNSRVKRTSESQQSSRERDNHSRTNRRNSGHSLDIKTESRIYASFHEDDAISILADDDRFTNETQNYMEPELRTETHRDYANDSLNDDTFQIHADSSSTIFDDQDLVRNQADSRKHGEAMFKTPAGRFAKPSRRSYKSRTDSNGSPDRQSDRNQGRSSYDKNGQQNRKVFGKNQFANRNFGKYRFNKDYDRKASDKGQLKHDQRSDNSKKPNEKLSFLIGKTGAILSEDRRVTNDDKKDRAKTGNDDRGKGRNIRSRNGNSRVGSSGITSSYRVKRKYFGKHFSSRQAHNEKDGTGNDRKERFSKLRNERDRRDFEKKSAPAIEETTPNDLGTADQGQQIIFIPNQDFQDGQAPPFVNQFVNQELPLGPVPQVPLQFIPSNVAPEAPQGTEYVFIPFDQLGDVSDIPFNHNNLNNSNTVSREIVQHNEDVKPNIDIKPKILSPKETAKATTSTQNVIHGLSKAQKHKIRLRKIRERRKALERRLERRVFMKIMRETKEKIKAEAALQRTGLKSKPLIKRISPPAATVGSRDQPRRRLRQNIGKKEVEEYDNVSDFEDVTDDDNGDEGNTFRSQAKGSGQRRGTFRKPGEPRRSMRGRATLSNSDRQGASEAWQSFDVRKVVERGSPRNTSRSPVNEERATNTNNMGSTRNTAAKRNRPITPLQITVNNDQYAEEEEASDEFNNNGYGQRRGKMVKEQKSGQMIDREEREENMYSRYQTNYTEDQSQPAKRWENSGGSRESIGPNKIRGGNGKFGGIVRNQPYQRKPRFTEMAQRNSQRNRYSPANRGQTSNINQNLGQTNFAGNRMLPPFPNNQAQQNVSGPFSQQQMSQAQNQMNVGQTFPHGVQQVGFNQSGMQFNASDPSLPPVSQGTVNISPFAMSGVGAHTDMSMPPTVASTPSSMSGVIMPQRNLSQHNLQDQKPFFQQQQRHHLLPDPQQIRSFSQQQQMQMGQTNVGINQQRSQFSNLGNQSDNRSWNKGSMYQQNQMHFQVSNQSGGNMQQQQQQQSGGTFQQKHFSNNQANQGSRSGMIGQVSVSRNQAFISGHPVSVKDSYLPTTPSDALQGSENLGSESRMTSSQKYTSRSNSNQVFGSVRGTAVPVSSQQASNMAAGQSGVNRTMDNRGTMLNKDRQYGTLVPTNSSSKGHSQNTFSSNDVDDEFGELLCVKCDKVFLSESVMRRHSKWHILVEAGVRELRCDNCEQGFTSSVAFDAHMAEKHRGNSWM